MHLSNDTGICIVCRNTIYMQMIDAPTHVKVLRNEKVYDLIQQNDHAERRNQVPRIEPNLIDLYREWISRQASIKAKAERREEAHEGGRRKAIAKGRGSFVAIWGKRHSE